MVLSGRSFALLGAVSVVAITAFMRPSIVAWVVPIDVAIVLLALVDHWLCRSDAPAVRRAQGQVEIGADAIELIDVNNAGDLGFVSVAPVGLRLRLNAPRTAKHADAPVEHLQ